MFIDFVSAKQYLRNISKPTNLNEIENTIHFSPRHLQIIMPKLSCIMQIFCIGINAQNSHTNITFKFQQILCVEKIFKPN